MVIGEMIKMNKKVTKFGKKTKVCNRCKIRKEAELFYDDNRYRDDKNSWCSQCYMDFSRKRRRVLSKAKYAVDLDRYRSMRMLVSNITSRVVRSKKTADVDDCMYELMYALESVESLRRKLKKEIGRLNREVVR